MDHLSPRRRNSLREPISSFPSCKRELGEFEFDGQHTNLLWKGPANTRRWPNADLMLGQRRRRWTNIKSALGHRLVFAWGESFERPFERSHNYSQCASQPKKTSHFHITLKDLNAQILRKRRNEYIKMPIKNYTFYHWWMAVNSASRIYNVFGEE